MPLSRAYLTDVKRLALAHRHNGETDEEVKDYILGFYDRFYLYVRAGKLCGYADYWISGEGELKTLYIYDIICKGNIFEMWKYCKDSLKENNIKHIAFKRVKYNDNSFRRYYRR